MTRAGTSFLDVPRDPHRLRIAPHRLVGLNHRQWLDWLRITPKRRVHIRTPRCDLRWIAVPVLGAAVLGVGRVLETSVGEEVGLPLPHTQRWGHTEHHGALS